jgi:hypothetical protein
MGWGQERMEPGRAGAKKTSDEVSKNKYVKVENKKGHEGILGSSGIAPSILNLGIN